MLTGDVFVSQGLISEDQLQLAMSKQLELGGTEPIARVMVEMGLITERDRVRVMGKVWGIPYADVSDLTPEPDAIALITPQVAKRFKCMPLARRGDKLIVAMANPLDVFVIDELRMATQLEIEPVISVEQDILAAIGAQYKVDTSVNNETLAGVIKDFDGDVEVRTGNDDEEVSADQLKAMGEDAPIIRLANLIVNQAVGDGASDIHIEPRKDGLLVRFRIDGVMVEAMRLPKKVIAPLTSRFKIVANMDIAEKRAPQDARISATINGKDFDFRVNTLPLIYGEKIVMRVLDKSGINVGLEKLGFAKDNFRILKDLAARSYGIVLVTGPTGSGKSTTLYSLINETNDGLKNITTIEDPVEYELESINQCSVNNRAGMTFAAGLRAMLRQDPDVIMIGEMRDNETATIAMEAALTGHLVFSTLHTNDAPSAPTRLVDMEVEPFLIASSIAGVLAQRLVRKICPKCKETYEDTPDSLRLLGFPVDRFFGEDMPETLTLHRGCGCDHCKGTGYKGRMGIHELMVVSDSVRDLIMHKHPGHILRKQAEEDGMKSLAEDALQKILDGHTSVEEVVRVIYA